MISFVKLLQCKLQTLCNREKARNARITVEVRTSLRLHTKVNTSNQMSHQSRYQWISHNARVNFIPHIRNCQEQTPVLSTSPTIYERIFLLFSYLCEFSPTCSPTVSAGSERIEPLTF
ncbi:hypothetical protein AB6A40_005579 [Gnathostoma spinigerum]|uniref:Uncharacterized protein n=1 Tax=Gnathostoma spinigerum TaxID=75299 RepID=A0ABD6ERI1_9BILA